MSTKSALKSAASPASLVSPAEQTFLDLCADIALQVADGSEVADAHKENNADLKGSATRATWAMLPIIAPLNDPEARVAKAETLAETLAKARGVSKPALRDERQKARFLCEVFDVVAATPDETRAKKNALTIARDLVREAKANAAKQAERDAVDADVVRAEVCEAGPWSDVVAMLSDPAGQDAFNRAMVEAVERRARCEAFKAAWAGLCEADRVAFILSL